MRYLCIIVLMAFFAVPAVAGEIYRYVDEHGKVTFTDILPGVEQQSAETMDIDTGQATDPATSQQQRLKNQKKLGKAFEQERLQREQEQEKLAQEEKEKLRQCHIAQDNWREAQRYGAVYDLDENGERVYLNDSEKAQWLRDKKADVDKYCN